jgi:magnesium chelatase family protein
LLDRIDLFTRVQYNDPGTLETEPLTSSAKAREMVLDARERQAARFAGLEITVNAQLDPGLLREHVALDERSEGILLGARQHGSLSLRGQHRALRVARTIADLAHSDRVNAQHLQKALSLRANHDAGELLAA